MGERKPAHPDEERSGVFVEQLLDDGLVWQDFVGGEESLETNKTKLNFFSKEFLTIRIWKLQEAQEFIGS